MPWFSVGVIEIEAVLAVPLFDAESRPPWPVAPNAAGSWTRLHANCRADQVGLFVAALAHSLDLDAGTDRHALVSALLADETLVVAGGLRLRDTRTGATVVPGCCAGLADWREWGRVLAGESPWLGHDPSPEVEFRGDTLRVWPDRASPIRHRSGADAVLVPSSALPGLLIGVQRDLAGFLDRVRAWTRWNELGEGGRALVAAMDRDFAITAPWEFPAVGTG